MPHVFLLRGRRLLYSWGIYVLVGLTAILLTIFRGVTDRLIPLYAIGAFMAFTLSQAGMVMHWKRRGPSQPNQARLKMFAVSYTHLELEPVELELETLELEDEELVPPPPLECEPPPPELELPPL